MGINKLIPFLKEKGLLKPFDTTWPENCKVAVDVPIFAHKFIYAERTYEGLERKLIEFAHSLKATCEPIFVFDGDRLQLKDLERERRSAARARTRFLQSARQSAQLECMQNELDIDIVCTLGDENVDTTDVVFGGIMIPTKEDYVRLREKLNELHFHTQQAKFEAEALCAHLVNTDVAWCCLTEDTDAVAFGSKRTIFKFLSAEPLMADLTTILEGLEFTMLQFVDLCCMFGCDFCENVHLIGPKIAYALMKKHGAWPDIYTHCILTWKEKTKLSSEVFNTLYPKARECFLTSCFEK